MSEGPERIPIRSDLDVVAARQTGRALAARLGFSDVEQTMIATAISELARNILLYAQRGEITVDFAQKDRSKGICIVATDAGPGIPDIEKALQEGYSSSYGLGMGLPGTRRLVDDFEIRSEPGKGTTVMARKWLH